MKFQHISYEIIVNGSVIKCRNKKEARMVVRNLVAKDNRVICDRVRKTPSMFEHSRIFRNDAQYPLNLLFK